MSFQLDARRRAADAPASAAERALRVDLAAAYRLVAREGWDDLVYSHISATVPGEPGHFLINPFGLSFEEVTASNLVKINEAAEIIGDTPHSVNVTGFALHAALHAARPDAVCVLHLHETSAIAVSAQKEGLLPLSQHALIVLPRLAYHDYEGIALNHDERERLVADIGDKDLMLLKNHGTLSVGKTAGDCWIGMYYLERACKMQIMAMSAGRENLLIAPEASQAEVRAQTVNGLGGPLAWPACLRKLDRALPGYDA
jgi:ribulose-5-phosphate 4-epimerase/fuculose-1-phosphate aldolase